MVVPALSRPQKAVVDHDVPRSHSTPPNNRIKSEILTPASSPSKKYLSSVYLSMHDRRSLPPRSLTGSPAPRLQDKTRKRLARYHTVEHAVQLLQDSRQIVLLTGAGISTSLDIPDFRSDDGFYSRLSSSIGVSEPEEFFSIDFFSHNSEKFWTHARPLIPKYARIGNNTYKWVDGKSNSIPVDFATPKYSPTHAFLTLLDQKKKLLTNYTQNIDGLEFAAGVSPDKIIQCHGSWDYATCLTCGKQISAKKYLPIIFEDGFPRCKCVPIEVERKKSSKRHVKKRKRMIYEGDSDHDSDDGTSIPKGLFKPNITFFGEPIPEYYVPRLESDKMEVDLLIIMGTSLKVKPVKTMVTEFPPNVPTIWINRDRFSGVQCDMPGVQLDIELLGECDVILKELCDRAGWKDDLTLLMWKNGARRVKEPKSVIQRMYNNAKSKCVSVSTGDNNDQIAHADDTPTLVKAIKSVQSSKTEISRVLPIRQYEDEDAALSSTSHADASIDAAAGDHEVREQKSATDEKISQTVTLAKEEQFHDIGTTTSSTNAHQTGTGRHQNLKIDLDIGTDWRWRITKVSDKKVNVDK